MVLKLFDIGPYYNLGKKTKNIPVKDMSSTEWMRHLCKNNNLSGPKGFRSNLPWFTITKIKK